MWECGYCGKTTPKRPWEKCPSCGFTLGRAKATIRKYKILTDICNLNNYDLLIDACAGCGKVQFFKGDIINGSPLIFDEIAKTKTPPAKCIFIECNPKTFKLLKTFCKDSDAKFINGDCNELIPTFVKGKIRTLVFIDPFGYGVPTIRRDMVIAISEIPKTDLLINFTWRIAREMGFVRKYLKSDDERNRKAAISYIKSLHIYWGNLDWLKKWGSMRTRKYAEKYALPLKENNKIEIYHVPQYGKLIYYLIFATKFETPKYGLMKWFARAK